MNILINTLEEYPEFTRSVAELMFEEFKETHKECFGIHDQFQFAEKVLALNQEDLPCFIAHDGNGRLLGACNIVLDDLGMEQLEQSANDPWFANFVVSAPSRGKGVGNLLLKKVAEWQTTPLYLWCHTQELKMFYEKRGWKQVNIIKNFLKYDEIYVMVLQTI